ncbi:MAG: HD domain-containing protein [Thauera sp.]|nr:HD domain-containing protein [Thauera sp.]
MLDDSSVPGPATNPARTPACAASSAPPQAAGDPYRQLYRVMRDLRTVVGDRNRRREAMHRLQRESIARLALAASRGRREALEHGLRVGALAALVGHALGAPRAWCDELFDAARTHDIGNLAIPDAILAKPGRLTSQEWAAIRRHPLDGARILGGASDALHTLAAEVALNHHEKWDGSGYPAGREGSNIPLSGRIVAVADFVDALGARASYRDALDEGAIFTLLELAAGMQFDPAVVAAMQRVRPQLARVRALAALHAEQANTGRPSPLWWHELATEA